MGVNNKNINVTINNKEDDEVVISLSAIGIMLKKFFTLWLAIAIIAGFVSVAIGTARTFLFKEPISALVSFTYAGIENGVDPSGKKFDCYDIINPTVLERALSDCDMDIANLEGIRRNVSIEGKIPEDVMDRILTYKQVYENAATGNLAAGEAMLNVDYNPTVFEISFNYGNTSLTRSESVQLLNAILEDYRDYFYEKFGYNQALGSSIAAIDYTAYDYSEQLDVFDDSITSLERYVKNLSREDTNIFRSTETGLSFNDIYKSAQTIRDIDFDRISSYISIYNVTKDKDQSIAYYNYKIDSLTRNTVAFNEQLKTIEDAISKYIKDTVLIFGNGTDGTDTSYSQASEEYDRLIQQRVSVSSDLATTKQRIKYYEQRRDALQNNKAGGPEKREYVEGELEKLNTKVLDLIALTEKTSNEYFYNVQYRNAYNILVPAASSAGASIKLIINNSILPCLLIEGLIFFIFIVMVFIKALIYCNNSNNKAVAAADAEDDGDDNSAADKDDEKSESKNNKKK